MKFSISQQIEEVEREIALRRDVYARSVAAGRMRQSVADYHLGRMQAALDTLRWVQKHSAELRTIGASTNEATP